MSDPNAATTKSEVDSGEGPLPSGWTKGFSRSQKRNYYCHASSNHTQWHFPTASEAMDPLKAKRRVKETQQRQQQGKRKAGEDKPNSSSSSLGNVLGDNIRIQKPSTASSHENKRSRILNNTEDDATCVAIIVPFRDVHAAQNRAKHLQQFIPAMHTFLQKQVEKGTLTDYHIYIVEQSDDNRKFNRGKLLNIGFDIARKNKCRRPAKNSKLVNHDVFIFHDVDLIPGDDLGQYYTKFPTVPLHIARVWERYSNNPKYFGGIVSFSESDMKRINGYPNTFWGWGGEDDEMQLRCEKVGLRWDAPRKGTITDLEDMNLKEKLDFLRQNRKWKCMVKWEALEEHEKTWRMNGLADLNYSVQMMTDLDRERRHSDGKSHATKITVDVKLNGNHWANEKCSMDYVYSG